MPTQYLKKFIENLIKQIAQGEIELVLDQVQNYLSSSPTELRDEAILLSARYNRLRRDERKGIITRDTAQIEQNKLVNSLLGILEELPFKVNKDFYPAFTPSAKEDLAIPQEVRLEKILGVNNLKQISWLEQGLKVSKSICRVLTPEGLGTGFMIGSGLVMTNNHVIPDQKVAAQSFAEFNYQNDLEDNMLPTCRYKLDKERFHTNISLDYTIVGVSRDPQRPELESWGHVFLNSYADPVPGEHVVIVQHPNGGLKQIVLTANQVVSLWEHHLHYTTDTMPGSSGAPVFNDMWQVIAIHHAGGELEINAKGDKRFINEGILISAIKPNAECIWPKNV